MKTSRTGKRGHTIRDAIEAIEPSLLAEFLVRMGWKRMGPWRDIGHDWITTPKEHVLVPATRRINDYVFCIQKVIELFADTGLALEDVTEMISKGASDIIRNRIDIPATKWGSLPADMASNTLNGLLEWLNASATAVQRRKSGGMAAADYLNASRVGQTEFGSYVIKLYVPVIVPNAKEDERTFAREVTLAATANLSFLSDEAYDLRAPLPAAMSEQAAAAILKIRPANDLWSDKCSIAVRYTPTVDALDGIVLPRNKQAMVPLRSELFDRAQGVFDRLHASKGTEKMTLQGHIVDLHMDPPGTKQPKYQITLQIGHPKRKVALRLLPVEYAKAVGWHKQKRLVQLEGRINTANRLWTVVDYKSLLPMAPVKGDDTPMLFK